MKICIFIFSVFLCSLNLFAKELKVESFELLGQKDLTAQTSPKYDLNGKTCAVIKVSTPEGMKFEGNVISSVYDVNEYIVYVSQGTKNIIIKYPGFEPLYFSIPTSDFPSGLESGRTYRMKIGGMENGVAIPGNENVGNTSIGANYVVFKITPQKGISFKIDNQIQNVENGEAMSFLKLGSHSYLVEAEGYAPKSGKINVTEGDTQIINVRLDSRMASLLIDSTTKESAISINGQRKGFDVWEGQLPSGVYNIEVSKPGYKTYTAMVELSPLEKKEMTIPQLAPIYGTLQVEYKPIGSTIIIDGNSVGITPKIISDISLGEHTITIEKESYFSFSSTINIQSNKLNKISGTLKPMILNDTKNGNIEEQNNKRTFKISGVTRNSKNHKPIMCVIELSRNGNPLDVYFTYNNGLYSFNNVQTGDKLEIYYNGLFKKEIFITDDDKIVDIYIDL